ncbi:recombinase family protein [Sphingosinicella humi]|uniref:Recombinase family protein n=1 Tax=Allosphingosinicella humi TaxID=2068657 RepID=A0A2U2J4V7_9SPHN|nr:recombinase family protein [Sphingosinicella humi]PWG03365.1 hypothetical protein DF286_11160 [Sphingosinicella humi]
MSSNPSRAFRKAYSYLRFSTPEQMKGDSLRRQMSMARDYARRHNLELDETLTFHDLGVSAFRGQNAAGGRLAYFLEAVHTGLVPKGSLLLIEQLDRLSRLTPRLARRILEDILEAGISIVTLNDGREYSPESLDDPIDLLVSIMVFMRANEESVTKARRLKQAWENKRANLAERPLTSRVPAWITLDRQSNVLRLIPERAKLVRRIFELTIEGLGQHKIAETFNREGLAPWGRGKHWHRSYIAKILSNPAVIGTFQPQTLEYEDNRKVRKPLEPVQGYFPAAVPEALWKEVQALQASQRAPTRGRHARSAISNILAGLATCPTCGGTATRVNKGKRSVPSFVCARAKAGAGCSYKSVRYEWVEQAIIERLPSRLRDTPAGGGTGELDDALASVEAQLDVLRDQIKTAVGNLTFSHSPALASKLKTLEAELVELTAARDDLLDRRSAASGPLVGQRVERLLEALEAASLDREAANHAMRSVFSRVVINYPHGELVFEWTHGGTCEVPFMWPNESHLTSL